MTVEADAPPVFPPRIVRLADVRPEKVAWLWRGYIPLAKVTLLDGDPALGKSNLTLDLAARVSRGLCMPDGSRSDLTGPAGVVLLNAEDGLGDTIRPRLEAAGADLSRVDALESVFDQQGEEQPIELPGDIDALRLAIARVNAALVVIDPLMAYLSPNTNSYRDQDIRRALVPVKRLAEETDAAIVVVRHLNKATGQSALYRGGGSIGIIGAARTGLLVGADPDDATGSRRILATTKNNLSLKAAALAYHIESAGDACRVVWDGPTEHTADTIVTDSRGDADGGALGEACQFLEGELSGGEARATKILAAARKLGIAEATLRRAKSKLGVKVIRHGFGDAGAYSWVLPAIGDHAKPIGDHPPDTTTYDGPDHQWDTAGPEMLTYCPAPGCIQIVATGAMCSRHHQDLRGAAIGEPADSPRP